MTAGPRPPAPTVPLALGCMRFTGPDHTREVVQAALAEGVRWFDTADVYGPDPGAPHRNEAWVAEAVASYDGDLGDEPVRIATKVGLRRPAHGRWTPDGRAGHLREAIAGSQRALAPALAGRPIDLVQLHAPDPRTALATSLRAMVRCQGEGLAAHLGVSNVRRHELDEAIRVADVLTLQVALSPFDHAALRNGAAEGAVEAGLLLWAHSPLGGPKKGKALARHRALARWAAELSRTPAELALAWLRDLHPRLIPVVGASRPASVGSAIRGVRTSLPGEVRRALDEAFPPGVHLRSPRAARAPALEVDGPEVVLVVGVPGSGKSTVARVLAAGGHVRLNRDERGGRLRDLLPVLDETLAGGRRRVVLDNTYPGRADRDRVREVAWSHGVPVRCIHLDTPLELAQRRAAARLLERHGALPDPRSPAADAPDDPHWFGPEVIHRIHRGFEPVARDEGFARVERRRIEADPPPRYGDRAALVLPYVPLLHRSRSGATQPRDAGRDLEVTATPGLRRALVQEATAGTVLVGLAWHPDRAAGRLDEADTAAILSATHRGIGADLVPVVCPHGPGPARCWCRPPLPGGLLAAFLRLGIDGGRSRLVCRHAQDRALARALGLSAVAPDALAV